ncbi:MAG: restriction endonuclease [Nanoarchaeota archaeon]
MSERQGSFLEGVVATIFQRAGLDTSTNVFMKGYEVDVVGSKLNYKVIVQCKHCEGSYVNIKDILHQWKSKNDIINADKVVLVIYGQEPNQSHYHLAEKLGIILIDKEKLQKLNSYDNEKLTKKLNELLKFDNEEYNKELNQKIVIYIVCGVLGLIVVYKTLEVLMDSMMFGILLFVIMVGFIASGGEMFTKKNRRRRK